MSENFDYEDKPLTREDEHMLAGEYGRERGWHLPLEVRAAKARALSGSLTLELFLRARIAEDEAGARSGLGDGQMDFRAIGSRRWLAECEAKRRIVADLEEAGRDQSGRHEEGYGLTTAIKHLAVVYADHPDYREEWRP